MQSDYRIVVGIDGSEDSERALRWALREAHQRGGTVQAVMVYDWAGTEAALLAGLGPDGERQHTEDVLADVIARVAPDFPGTSIATEALRGGAGARLAEVATDADLLVVGSHGKGRLYHAVLGSVAEECVRLARCPVVVIPVPHQTRTRAGALVTSAHQAGSLMDYDIHRERLAAHPTAVRRAALRPDQFGPWLADTYPAVAGRLERVGAQIDGPPFARYAIDAETMMVEAGFPVTAPVTADDTITPSSLPGGEAAVTTHVGPYDQLGDAYQAISVWLARHGRVQISDHWEVYRTDPHEYPDPAQWRTDVLVPCAVTPGAGQPGGHD